MTSDVATIISAIIAAAAVVISVLASLYVARSTVQGKLNELRQTQIGDVLQQRIEHYPSLWSLCQDNITRPMFSERPTQAHDGWASRLSDALEAWHTGHGLFLSEPSYKALHRLRKRARVFAEQSDTAAAAKVPLGELEMIWTTGFTEDGKLYTSLAASLKNDLGSYAQAALSQ
jgi:hypothetical protein